ncbi:hypothetical protein GYMLUDRAFT_43744 [Collybiopsis luxurians FD-317 M1]|uniref:Unplaced genomic scaffold GYMLUscaffold_27, whole genome shotgun sequence n=1 Tax=Collybiopsis luxurians FD-317 M1 TaxID=944289 RepID=A0A0D0CNR9_9AGAR|nr:hypothetical protein GYMLUDRAFT_43744 [Collybiopsis luxurians FD-317 M1]
MPDLSVLKDFALTEILNEEPDRCRLALLGTLPSSWNASAQDQRLQAIIRIEKNAFASEHAPSLFADLVHRTELMGSTDIYIVHLDCGLVVVRSIRNKTASRRRQD